MAKIYELSEKQDKELVTLLVNGSKEAYEELYVRYKTRLIRFCIRLMKDAVGAEDIVQDVFLQLWIVRVTLIPDLSFWGYLQTMAKNLILYKFRQINVHERFVRYTLLNEKDSTNQTEDSIVDNDYEKLLDTLIEGLPPRQKEAYLLSRKQGLTYHEIAEKLQISVYTVREHISLALEKIRNQLPGHTGIHFWITDK